MSRRDTIIIAVLVNAALLMILFATAMRSDHQKETPSSKMGSVKIEDLAKKSTVEHPLVEDLLNEYVTPIPLAESSAEENIFAFDEVILATPSRPTEIVESPRRVSSSNEEIKTAQTKRDDQFVNVTVKKGDFLEKIAKANNTTVTAIMSANNLSSSQLKIGQVLRVPLNGIQQPKQKSTSPFPSSLNEGEYYIVKEGDNPWLIATRNKINLDELLRINGLDEQKAKRLRPGDKLKIR